MNPITERLAGLKRLEAAAIKQIPTAPGYGADRNGNIWSLSSNWRGRGARKLTPSNDRYGYPKVRIVINGRRLNKTVHGLVAAAFYGPRPEGMQVRHIDGSRTNNKASNLAYGSAKENASDRTAHGRCKAAANGRSSSIKSVLSGKNYFFRKDTGKYVANFQLNGKRKVIGSFLTEQEAILAVKLAKKSIANKLGDTVETNSDAEGAL